MWVFITAVPIIKLFAVGVRGRELTASPCLFPSIHEVAQEKHDMQMHAWDYGLGFVEPAN
jgi:hypothetical protein